MKMLAKSMAVLFAAMQLISCVKNSDTPSNNSNNPPVSGSYNITSFISSGDDQTSDVSAYTLQFNDGGVLLGTSSSETITGTWKKDDSNSNEIKINFPSAPLNQLNRSWHIQTQTDDTLILTDDDVNDDNPDRLELHK